MQQNTPKLAPGHKFLAVYGTLRNFHPNSKRFGLEPYLVREGVRVMGYRLFDLGWFPGVRPGQGSVECDIFMVPDEMFEALDAYEGVPNLYTRESVMVGGIKDVQLYVYAQQIPEANLIEDGSWQKDRS